MSPKRLILLCLSTLLIAACRPPGPTFHPGTDEDLPVAALDPFDIDWGDRDVFESGLISSVRPVLGEMPQNSTYHMDWEIAPDLTSLTGRVEIKYTNREQQHLDEIILRLYPNISGGEMVVERVAIDGEMVESSLAAGGSALRIPLDQPLPPAESTVVSFEYVLRLPAEMSGNYGLFGSFDGLLVLQESYPIIPVVDEQGWDIDIPSPHGDLTHLDASFYIVRVTLPVDLKVIASGNEIDRVVSGDMQSVTFAAGPVRDYYLAASADFTHASKILGETTINSYTLPGAEGSVETVFDVSRFALSTFSDLLGRYPYTEFDLISTPMQALGMEYPGIVALNMDMYAPGAEIGNVPGAFYLEGTTAHEVAHQWFYNLVGNDQLEEPWLDEALAQYLTGIYYKQRYGDGAFREYRQSWLDRWQRVESQPTPISLPAEKYSGRAYSAIVYGRGPLFVEALADEMGDDDFWHFLRAYVQKYEWEIAQPQGFISLAEETCACDLSELWATWGVTP